MINNKEANNSYKQKQWQKLTLAEYVHRRNGVPLGSSSSMRNMLHRSLGASSFAKFWQYWNPIWGYGLGKYVYSPLRQVFPASVALVLTFVISGSIHDLATMAVRGSVAFLFTPWFFLMGIGVLLGHAAGMNLSSHPWWVRVCINLIYIILCLVLTLLAKPIFGFP